MPWSMSYWHRRQTFQFENPQETLVEFVESISLSGAIDERDDEQDVVTVMTLHAAKGLEFSVVFWWHSKMGFCRINVRSRNEGKKKSDD